MSKDRQEQRQQDRERRHQKDQQKASDKEMERRIAKLQEMAPGKGYLKAHKDVENPYTLLGGPIEIEITQDGGGVFVALPSKRQIDNRIFGTPEMPLAYAGTPGITGLPPMMREVKGGKFTQTTKLTPFGDKHKVMPGAQLEITARDATPTDARRTNDSVDFHAKWEDQSGNTYSVRCTKVLPHGLEYPTFGGVVTNHLMHGFTNIGTPLMPTEFAYFAFWGVGDVMKNGEVVDGDRLVHGMLTEYVRTEGYQLGHDEDVTPGRRHFHLMVAPFEANMKEVRFEHAAVDTGFELPNGKTLPFWHVMFESLEIESRRAMTRDALEEARGGWGADDDER